jgi:ferredoxin-nitrite reductase
MNRYEDEHTDCISRLSGSRPARGGRVSEWVCQRVLADEVPGGLANLLRAFAAHREDGQPFREWVEETGTEAITDLLDPEETSYEDPALHDAKQSWYPFDDGESPAPTAPDGQPLSADD